MVNEIKKILKTAGIPDFDFESRCIIKYAPNQEFEAAKRRINGEPLQYILGEWEFYGLPFKVGEGVLIPRPDTETLVDAVLEHFRRKSVDNPVIIDLCAGSGCIAVSLKKRLPNADITAVELSKQALPFLRENIRLNGVDVHVAEGDVTDEKLAASFSNADCIVSNPPYLTDEEMLALQKEVRFEPELALRGGADGLDFYRVIPKIWKAALKKGGLLAFEIGSGQAADLTALLRPLGYGDIQIIRDLGENDRVIAAFNR